MRVPLRDPVKDPLKKHHTPRFHGCHEGDQRELRAFAAEGQTPRCSFRVKGFRASLGVQG